MKGMISTELFQSDPWTQCWVFSARLILWPQNPTPQITLQPSIWAQSLLSVSTQEPQSCGPQRTGTSYTFPWCCSSQDSPHRHLPALNQTLLLWSAQSEVSWLLGAEQDWKEFPCHGSSQPGPKGRQAKDIASLPSLTAALSPQNPWQVLRGICSHFLLK